jgi:crotonobetainyl-CoA:carnitine CoA-transferase CaiB-like acyl-CoA transferase
VAAVAVAAAAAPGSGGSEMSHPTGWEITCSAMSPPNAGEAVSSGPAAPGADTRPLTGIRICDFTGQLAGAGATRYLAAFGAQVIRIEDPVKQGRWDILRGNGPFVDDRRGINLGGAFNNHNIEKLGITLNLRTDRAKELLRQLVAISDVVGDNFAAGVLDRLGFGSEQLKEIRPDIVYVSNSGFGSSGPYDRYKTWGPVVQAVSGLTFASGLPDQPPAGWGYSYMDHQGGNWMAIAILGALFHRRRTGEGQWVDMACTEPALAMAGPALLDFSVNGRPLRRPGMPNSNRSQFPAMAPHGIYQSAGDDDWVAISCRDDDDWAALGEVVGQPWVKEERFATQALRLQHEDELDDLMAQWTQTRDRVEVADALRNAGVPATIVAQPQDRIDHDPSTEAWGLWPTAHHTEMGEVRVEGLPVHLSRTDWAIDHGAPCLGEHNDFVLGDLLGLDGDEIAALREAGVI